MPAGAEARVAPIGACADLAGWNGDDHTAALTAFLESAGKAPAFSALTSASGGDARAIFERCFAPGPAATGMLTAYCEPELSAARRPSPDFPCPIYAPPADLREGAGPTRAEIAAGALEGRARALFHLADPVEAFFLEIQGSGRLRLAEGGVARVGFAGKTGWPYRSLGAHLRETGALTGEITAERIKAHLRAQGDGGRALMNLNPASVFFRELDLGQARGPLGALGVSLTPMRSIAVDPDHIPLGAPVWVEAEIAGAPLRRLCVAQDIGGAIRGAGRADLFFGWGAETCRRAGEVAAPVRLTPLLPRGV